MLRLVADNKKRKNSRGFIDDLMQDDDISFLYTALNMEKERVLYLDEAIESGIEVDVFYSNLQGLEEYFRLPDIDKEMVRYGILKKQYYPPKDFDKVHTALSRIIYQALADDEEYEEKNPNFSFRNISKGIRSIFPDPNDLIDRYKTFYRWQEDGLEKEAVVFWMFNISHYSNRLSAIERLRKFNDNDPSDYKKPNLYRVK